MLKKNLKISVIGGGLAGCEAAYYLARIGIAVDLYEQRKGNIASPAHHSDKLGELVCSNSLKNFNLDSAPGIFKLEGRILNSLILEAADNTAVPAGGALACDRELFAAYIDKKITENKLINVIAKEVSEIPEGIVIVAIGPLGNGKLLQKWILDTDYLYFYDASAPLVSADSINYQKVFLKNRYQEEAVGDYINCPMSKEEYYNFYNQLITAETVPLKQFEKERYFSGCQPIEIIAKSGDRALSFGPLKPRGLNDGEKRHYAVVQLRQDNVAKSLYSLVGFQTNLTYPEQKRVFSMIPGLENAEFVRFGLMHRNHHLNAPLCLTPHLNLKNESRIFVAGQFCGVEGYVESAFSGLWAAINAARLLQEKSLLEAPKESFLFNLINYITTCSPEHFQPMNINWGLVSVKKEERANYHLKVQAAMEFFKEEHEIFKPI